MVGGGMRQAGVIAAAGRYALAHNIDRLSEDHEKARLIAEAVNARFGQAAENHTNMVFVNLAADDLQKLLDHLNAKQIRAQRARWVTHLDVSFEDVERITAAVAEF